MSHSGRETQRRWRRENELQRTRTHMNLFFLDTNTMSCQWLEKRIMKESIELAPRPCSLSHAIPLLWSPHGLIVTQEYMYTLMSLSRNKGKERHKHRVQVSMSACLCIEWFVTRTVLQQQEKERKEQHNWIQSIEPLEPREWWCLLPAFHSLSCSELISFNDYQMRVILILQLVFLLLEWMENRALFKTYGRTKRRESRNEIRTRVRKEKKPKKLLPLLLLSVSLSIHFQSRLDRVWSTSCSQTIKQQYSWWFRFRFKHHVFIDLLPSSQAHFHSDTSQTQE